MDEDLPLYIPKNVKIAAERLSTYSRNTFRLETISSDIAGPGRVVTVNLPEALLDMKSFKFNFDVTTTSVGTSTNIVHGGLPDGASSLISRMEVYLNGQQIQQGAQEYGTVCRLLRISRASRDHEGSVTRALSHGFVNTSSSRNTAESAAVCISEWLGCIGESSCRYWPLHLMGSMQIRLTFAPQSVLSFKQTGSGDFGADFSGASAITNAGNISYSVSNMYFTVDSVSIGDVYDKMLLSRLSEPDAYIPINAKEYYTFLHDNITAAQHTNRFSLSASSVDRIYSTCRDSNYQSRGIKSHLMTASSLSETGLENAFRFRSFNNKTTDTLKGDLRWQFSINNVPHPQHRANLIDGLHSVALTRDKVYSDSGNLITSMAQYEDGMFAVVCTLCDPSEPISVQSGYDSKGINSLFSVSFSGQNIPAASTTTQETGVLSNLAVVETTMQIRTSLGKQVGCVF